MANFNRFARSRNDDGHPAPSSTQTPIDEAFSIFIQRARAENRNYFGDMVKDNLGTNLQQGMSPQAAVDELFSRAPGRRH